MTQLMRGLLAIKSPQKRLQSRDRLVCDVFYAFVSVLIHKIHAKTKTNNEKDHARVHFIHSPSFCDDRIIALRKGDLSQLIRSEVNHRMMRMVSECVSHFLAMQRIMAGNTEESAYGRVFKKQ